MARLLLLIPAALSIIVASWSCGGVGGGGPKRPQVAYVTNGIASFWTIAAAGA